MRIVILSIALLFCAFSAHSQVLKSAGVWYFLDVDSMTARPAVLPNGTELAYVIGTKTVYYWNRNTSTWTAYGSAFNRDSIYFDSSIVGSGTVGDPWRVDSTLFATIAGVGDSIANALLGYLPIEGGTLTGTGGAGFIGFPSQGVAPGTPASGLNVYSQGSSFNWKGTDGHERQITSSLTGGRNYALPDINGTFALGTGTTDRSARWTGTNTLGAGSWSDNLTRLQAQVPVQFQSVTTAGLPTGVAGYTVYNSTIGGIGWYDGTRWDYVPKADRSAFTSTYIPFANSSGQLTEDPSLTHSSSAGQTTLTKNQNAATLFRVNNSTTGTAAWAGFYAQAGSDAADNGVMYKISSGYTTYKNQVGGDLGFYNGGARGNIALLNDYTSGNFNVAVGGSSTAQLTLESDGDLRLTGKVGVGISPSEQIDVLGSLNGFFRLKIKNNSTGTAAYAGSHYENSLTNSSLTVFKTGTGYTTYKSLKANDSGIYNAGAAGDISILNDYVSGNINFSAGASSSVQMILMPSGRLGIGNTSPQRTFHVSGEARITDLTTDAPTRIVGADGDGDLGELSISGGLSIAGGVLTGANIYTADGTISTDRTITLDGANGDYVNINGTQNSKIFDLYFSADGQYNNDGYFSFKTLKTNTLNNSTAFNQQSYVYGSGDKTYSSSISSTAARSSTGTTASSVAFSAFRGSGTFKSEHLMQIDSTGKKYNFLTFKSDSLAGSGRKHLNGFAVKSTTSGNGNVVANTPSWFLQTIFSGTTKFDWLRVDNLDTDTTSNRISFYNGKYTFPNATPGSGDKVLQWSSGTPSFVSLSSLSNGIYSGSATLANHTTRARVPDDGNLYFSQTYNAGADSSFFYFQNAGGGERYVGFGITDTASTGGASLIFGNGGAGDLSFELKNTDALSGTARVRGLDGDLLLSSSNGNISLSTDVANEVQVVGLVRAKQEAYYEITSTSSPQTLSNVYSDNFVNQGGTQASFTLLFPASPEDGQILSITWGNAVSTLTLDGNGNTITGSAVTTAVAGTRRQFKYYASAATWIKIY